VRAGHDVRLVLMLFERSVDVTGRKLSWRAAGADQRRDQGQAEPSHHRRLHNDEDDAIDSR